MTAITFDTHENVKKLTAAGFTEEQAEVQTKIIADLVDQSVGDKTRSEGTGDHPRAH